MTSIILQKIIFSVVTFLIIFLISQLLGGYSRTVREKHKIQKSRYFALKRLIRVLSSILFFGILILIWGIDFKDIWGYATGIIAMVAVAFFAVWSLIGNILAGIIIFFTSPFKIDDHIRILPDDIDGKVLAINTFYTLLIDEEGSYINIPNSLFFQKYIKIFRKQK